MPNLLSAYMQGQQAVENNKRNRLLDLELQDAPARQERQNRLADLQETRQRQIVDAGAREAQQGIDEAQRKEIIAGAQFVLQSKTPKAEVERNFPEFIQEYTKAGGTWDDEDDDGVRDIANDILTRMSAKAGVGPAPAPVQYERIDGPRGSVLQRDPRTNEIKQVVGPDNSQPAPARQTRFRTLNPQEIAAAGLPPGTSAQMNEDTGEIKVVSKRDVTSTLTPKDATVAKLKLTQIKVARQQVQNARQKFASIKNTLEAGPGLQGRIPSEAGRLFDKAVDTMRSSITAITRVPGVGAMSDYETRLDQSKFPDRTDYESVSEEQLNQLDNLLSTVEQGYNDLLSGGQPQQSQQPGAPQQQGAPVRVNSKADALKLPPGTTFVTPDGRVMRRN